MGALALLAATDDGWIMTNDKKQTVPERKTARQPGTTRP
jgi:hypothetical protein